MGNRFFTITSGFRALSKYELLGTRGGGYRSGSGFLGQLFDVLCKKGAYHLVLPDRSSETLFKYQTSLIRWDYAKLLSRDQLFGFALPGQRYINSTRHLSTIVVALPGKAPSKYRPIIADKRHNKGSHIMPFDFHKFSDIMIEKLSSRVFEIAEKQKKLITAIRDKDPQAKDRPEVLTAYEHIIEWVSYILEEKRAVYTAISLEIKAKSYILLNKNKKAFNNPMLIAEVFESQYKGSLKWLGTDKKKNTNLLNIEKYALFNFESICNEREDLLNRNAIQEYNITSDAYIKALFDKDDSRSFIKSLIDISKHERAQIKKEIQHYLGFCQRTMLDGGPNPRRRTFGYFNQNLEWYALGASHLVPKVKNKYINKLENLYNHLSTHFPPLDRLSRDVFYYAPKVLARGLRKWFKLTPNYLHRLQSEFTYRKKNQNIPSISSVSDMKFHEYVMNKKSFAIQRTILNALLHDYRLIFSDGLLEHMHKDNFNVKEKAAYEALVSLLEHMQWRGVHFSQAELCALLPPQLRDTHWAAIKFFNKIKLPVFTNMEDFLKADLKKVLRTFIKNRSISAKQLSNSPSA